jgi:predicted metal-dependent hydrolase
MDIRGVPALSKHVRRGRDVLCERAFGEAANVINGLPSENVARSCAPRNA